MIRPIAFSNPGSFFRGNLHTHSTNSDGALSPQDVCRQYEINGYDFMCLSDHFVGLFDYPISDTAPFRNETFTTILGAELHTGALDNGEIWHMLAVGLPADFTPPDAPNFDAAQSSESMESLAQRCVDAGAFVAIAHPQWFGLTLADARKMDMAHAVEIYNHGCAVECERGDGFAILDLLLTEGRHLSACATDDAHFHEADHFGGWVMVKAVTLDPDALLEALKAGAYYSSQGPLLHDIQISDDKIKIACSPCQRIMAVGAGAASKQVMSHGMSSAELPLARFREGGWLRITVADADGKKAWSNPIWLD